MVKQGDIFYVDFKPSKGHEQINRRPAIALSHDLVQATSNMTIVAPISSTQRNFPMYHTLTSSQNVYGKVLLDQTIALDLQARSITQNSIVDRVSKAELIEIIELYKLLFTVDE
ncbi:type II toxin-antitoxin system PemK/MazF family toxin [Lactobacillus sp. ESL0684]|uniref:type II toxin-antitoxin system PemK/MazF family toxin n=1 Tax=unclassified Lactobacillus TaxID=2620435 RepID=UPI0023FA23D6|nr:MULTISPECIES: type II toxin-antitoxin system PemK/MazF family toxin [unclassified Lactobacillus]WEV39968.1 type II toxin-antitoxin system PemK/MazF family toxin [Lactobacillus sp. ESL0681]WEV43490.1 type II toxin-antitoxin system PemK/MazF family toxin [Lactobacillus sp. ESL0684]